MPSLAATVVAGVIDTLDGVEIRYRHATDAQALPNFCRSWHSTTNLIGEPSVSVSASISGCIPATQRRAISASRFCALPCSSLSRRSVVDFSRHPEKRPPTLRQDRRGALGLNQSTSRKMGSQATTSPKPPIRPPVEPSLPARSRQARPGEDSRHDSMGENFAVLDRRVSEDLDLAHCATTSMVAFTKDQL